MLQLVIFQFLGTAFITANVYFQFEVNNLHSSVHMSNLLHGVIKMDVSNFQGSHATYTQTIRRLRPNVTWETEKQATFTIMNNFLMLHQLILLTCEYGDVLPRSQIMLEIGATDIRSTYALGAGLCASQFCNLTWRVRQKSGVSPSRHIICASVPRRPQDHQQIKLHKNLNLTPNSHWEEIG